VALVSFGSLAVARAGVERIFGGVVGHAMDMPADDRVVGIAEQGPRAASAVGAVVAIVGILPEGVGDLDGLSAVDGVVDVDRRGAAPDIAVVAPDEHFFAVDIPGMNAVEGVEVPAWVFRVLGCVRKVVLAFSILYGDRLVGLQVVRTAEQFGARGEQNVAILEDDTEGDLAALGKGGTVWPGAAIIFRQVDGALVKTERLVVALRIDVRTFRLKAVPEVIR
jgi:hypothetical protein